MWNTARFLHNTINQNCPPNTPYISPVRVRYECPLSIQSLVNILHRFLQWCMQFFVISPASTKLIGGYTGITLSVCPSVRPSVYPSVDRIVSALYLQQYLSDPFHICTSYQATSEGVSRVMPDQIWLNGMGSHEAAGGILRTQAF